MNSKVKKPFEWHYNTYDGKRGPDRNHPGFR